MKSLEDHLGDILRKARTMSNASPAAAANAAGIAENELSALEATGQCPKKINFPALAPLLGPNAAKLEAVASGWLPSSKDLSAWCEIRVITTAGEGLTVNCYLVWDEVTRDATLFDTGLDAKPILDCIAAEQIQLRHIFITHSHWDHVEALPKIREAWPKARRHSGSKNVPGWTSATRRRKSSISAACA